MKIRTSLFSKDKSVLGINVESHEGMKVNSDNGQISRVTYIMIEIGILIGYISFDFLAHESEPIEVSDKMKSFISTLKENIDEAK